MVSVSRRIAGGAAWSQLLRLVDTGLTFIFQVIAVRQLGPDNFGQYSVISALILTANLLSTLGMEQILGSRIVPLVERGETRAARELIRRLLLVRLGLCATIGVVLLSITPVIAQTLSLPALPRLILLVIALIVVMSFQDFFFAVFVAILQLRQVVLFRTIGLVLSLIFAGMLLISKQLSIDTVLSATLLGYGFSTCGTLFYLLRLLRSFDGGESIVPPWLRYGLVIWLNNLVSFLVLQYSSVALLAGLMQSPRQAGYYTLAVLPASRIWTLMTAGIAPVLLPSFAALQTRNGDESTNRFWRLSVIATCVLVLPGYAAVIGYADVIVHMLYGAEYSDLIPLMRIYTLLMATGTLVGGAQTSALLYATDRARMVLVISIGSLILDLLLLWWLIPIWGSMGAVIADGSVQILIGLSLLFVILRLYPSVRLPGRPQFSLVLSLVLGFGLIPILFPVESVPGLVASGSAAITVTLLGALVLKPLNGLQLPQWFWRLSGSRLLRVLGAVEG